MAGGFYGRKEYNLNLTLGVDNHDNVFLTLYWFLTNKTLKPIKGRDELGAGRLWWGVGKGCGGEGEWKGGGGEEGEREGKCGGERWICHIFLENILRKEKTSFLPNLCVASILYSYIWQMELFS